jgi:c-di-GMP-binding flagellar brake protein YcgR
MRGHFYGFLLQYNALRIPAGTDASGLLIFIAVVAVLILVAVVASRIVGLFGNQTTSRRKYNRFLFSRSAQDLGLERAHIQYLERLVRNLRVKYPTLIFTNPELLDAVLKKGIAAVERQIGLPERERVNQLNLIWEIKQMIELGAKRGIGLKSTFLIKPGQTLIVTPFNGERYHSKVLSNHTSGITINFPVVSVEKEHLFKKANKLKVFFWRDNDSGYSFMTKIIDTDRTQNMPSLHILHSRKLKREQHRKFSRKPLKKSCFIYPAELISDEKRDNQGKKLIVRENLRHMGIISDVSVGGCSVTSTKAYKKGTYLKFEFDIKPGSQISAFGKVQSILRQSGGSTNIIMHIQFLKLSNTNRNQIYSYIYNYI